MKDFLTLARERYSVRAYRETPVEQEKLDLILRASQLAPTACNYQPQKIYVVKSAEARAALASVCPCTFNAPVVFVIGYDDSVAAVSNIRSGRYSFGEIDNAIVCCHMMMEATDLGLGSCWVGYFNPSDVTEALGLPGNVIVTDLLPVGYAAENAVPSPKHSDRRPLSETVVEL